MTYAIKSTKGRKKQAFKIRSVRGITPKGTRFSHIEGDKIIYKRI